jgi:hypothetical protein
MAVQPLRLGRRHVPRHSGVGLSEEQMRTRNACEVCIEGCSESPRDACQIVRDGGTGRLRPTYNQVMPLTGCCDNCADQSDHRTVATTLEELTANRCLAKRAGTQVDEDVGFLAPLRRQHDTVPDLLARGSMCQATPA